MKSNRLLLTLAWLLVAWVSKAQYTEDILGTTYQQQTICMPDDYEGKTISTLVRKAEPQTGRRARQSVPSSGKQNLKPVEELSYIFMGTMIISSRRN